MYHKVFDDPERDFAGFYDRGQTPTGDSPRLEGVLSQKCPPKSGLTNAYRQTCTQTHRHTEWRLSAGRSRVDVRLEHFRLHTQTDRQTYRQTCTQTHRHTEWRLSAGRRRVDVRLEHFRLHTQTDRQTCTHTHRHTGLTGFMWLDLFTPKYKA